MGGDGGSIPQRIDQVKTKKKQQKASRQWTNMTLWRLCQLTQQPLTEGPIVACGLGRLYIKEAVIEALLNRTSTTSAADTSIISHVKSIKDVKDALLTRNPDFDKGKHEVHTDYLDTHMTEFICPIVGIEMNGTHRFCILWSCGHVISEKALQAVDASTRECLVCNKPFELDDIIFLYSTDEAELAEYQQRMEARRNKAKEEKKRKKAAEKAQEKSSVSGIPQLTAVPKLSIEAREAQKRGKINEPKKEEGTEIKKAKTIQDDPNKSKVFKSLFTSSEDCKKQPRAHWVTYNPQYY